MRCFNRKPWFLWKLGFNFKFQQKERSFGWVDWKFTGWNIGFYTKEKVKFF